MEPKDLILLEGYRLTAVRIKPLKSPTYATAMRHADGSPQPTYPFIRHAFAMLRDQHTRLLLLRPADMGNRRRRWQPNGGKLLAWIGSTAHGYLFVYDYYRMAGYASRNGTGMVRLSQSYTSELVSSLTTRMERLMLKRGYAFTGLTSLGGVGVGYVMPDSTQVHVTDMPSDRRPETDALVAACKLVYAPERTQVSIISLAFQYLRRGHARSWDDAINLAIDIAPRINMRLASATGFSYTNIFATEYPR